MGILLNESFISNSPLTFKVLDNNLKVTDKNGKSITVPNNDSVVHKSVEDTIDSTKTFTSSVFFVKNDIDLTKIPSKREQAYSFFIKGKDMQSIGSYEITHELNGDLFVGNLAERTMSDGTIKYARVGAKISETGLLYSEAPTVVLDADDNSIATTSWVKNTTFPSNKSVLLEILTTDSTYIAPENGYFSIHAKKIESSDKSHVTLYNTTNYLQINSHFNGIGSWNLRTFMPVKKGQYVKLTYSNIDVTNSYFYFIYAFNGN